jgi:hypothetical protein
MRMANLADNLGESHILFPTTCDFAKVGIRFNSSRFSSSDPHFYWSQAMCGPAVATPKPAKKKPMSGGLQHCWGLAEPPSLDQSGASEHVKQFTEKFKAAMVPVNTCLQFTKCSAVKEKHESMVADRDFRYNSFQTVRADVASKSEADAKGPIAANLGEAQVLAGKANTFKQETEKSLTAWKAKEAALIKSDDQIGELDAWKDPAFENLNKSSEEIQAAVDVNKFDEAVKLLDQHLPKLKPVYDAYIKQKEAKQKYDAEYKKIEPQLPKASQTPYKKLAPAQGDIAEVQKQMESAVQAKDYVKALELIGNLSVKATAYTAAVTDLEKHKQAYEKVLPTLKPRLAEVPKSTYQKLAKQKEEITTTQGQMETAAKDGEFEKAEQMVNQMGAKLDALETARAALEKEKKEYDDAKAKLDPKLKGASQTDENPKLEPMTKQIAAMQGQIEESAKKEEFHEAAALATKLSTLIDEYKKTKPGSVYEIVYPAGTNQKFTGTAEDLAALRIAIAGHAAKVLRPLTRQAEFNRDYHRDLNQLFIDYIVIADIVNAMGGMVGSHALAAVLAKVNEQKPALDEAEKAVSITNNADAAKAACNKAREAINAASEAINKYLEALDKGASRTITVLQVIEVTCFAVGAAAGGAVLGGGVAATFVAGAGFGALQSVSEDGLKNVVMDQKKVEVKEIGLNALINAIASGAGNVAGGPVGKKVGVIVFQQALVKGGIKNRVAAEIVKEAVEGSLSNGIQQVFSSGADKFRGKATWEDVGKAVLIALITGGLAKRIAGNATRNSAACKNLSQEEFEVVEKELAGLTKGP